MDITLRDNEDLQLESYISQSLLNHLYEGIYFVDNNREIKFWNKGAENITGFKAHEVVGKRCFDNVLCHENEKGENLCGLCCPLMDAIDQNAYKDERIYLYHKDGNRIPVWVHVSPIKNEEGKILGAVEVFHDDSDYEALKIANQKLESLNELKNQFLGMAAHDLRNPLSVIKSYSSFLLEINSENLNQAQMSMLTRMKSACETMLMLINDLLDISAIESGKISLNKQKTRLEEILNPDNFSVQIMAKHKNIDIKIDPETLKVELNVDAKRIIQVLENLLSNAVKFSFANTTITIKTRKLQDSLQISIIDQGQGIPEKDLPKLFKPFQKTSIKPTDKETSTGLGLVIVKKIVELHHGKVEVESKFRKGSEFTIYLPL